MNPGDIVAVLWPETDWDDDRAGTEQIVEVGNVLGGRKKGTTKHTVVVTLFDPETMLPVIGRNWRAVSPLTVVLALLHRKHLSGDDDGRDAGDDLADPLQRRRL